MMDLAIELEHRPGALADMGEALGRAGVSIEGGGAFRIGNRAIAHFLFEDGSAARRALEGAGIRVLAERRVLVRRLEQGEPGQLGRLARRLGDAGIDIEVVYSDHANRLVLVLDDPAGGADATREWDPGAEGRAGAR
jgi:hypothetical protein